MLGVIGAGPGWLGGCVIVIVIVVVSIAVAT